MLKLFNYLSRKVENFKPKNPPGVSFYTCGPTTYDFAHIGNLRTFIFEDILKRTLKKNGYKVTHVMNITDVDDKIIKGSVSQGSGAKIEEFSKPYESAFFEDIEKLNLQSADYYPKATEHVTEMIELIEVLLKKGVAYMGDDGIYFSIDKFANYGRLSGLNRKNLKVGARISADEYDKEKPGDFVLWKFKKEGEPSWETSFGEGRPGWHIECSAMAMEYLGESIDIHAGAVDLLFPHHENEIAQSEAATEQKFVNFWLEGEHLQVTSQKMAKSVGNIITLRDLEKRNFDPLAFRYLVLTAHYRTQLNFTWDALEACQNALTNLRNHFSLYSEKGKVDQTKRKEFLAALSDDLDTPQALSILWEVVRSQLPPETKKATVLYFDEIFGLGFAELASARLPKGAAGLIKKREQLRHQNRWSEADKLRIQLKKMGVEVEDTKEGSLWRIIDGKTTPGRRED